MKVIRKKMGADGVVSPEERIVEFDVKPGWKAGNKVTFRK